MIDELYIFMRKKTTEHYFDQYIYYLNIYIEFAIACAALAIACASLSIIAIWFSGIYFHVRRRTNRTLCFLFLIGLEVFLACKSLIQIRKKTKSISYLVCTSLVVWILLISETARLGVSINRFMFEWPMWLAVGASGGYLMSFITIIISYCTIRRRGNKMERDYDPPRNHF